MTPPASGTTSSTRPRARELGIPFPGRPGAHNALTDVGGVEVGTVTLVDGSGPLRVGHGPVRTGVTAVLPRGRGGVGASCAAGWFSLNGNGEMTGTAWLEETGALSLPVLVTNTHAVGPCHRGVIDWVSSNLPEPPSEWLLPVVAETWDGYLNDIFGSHIRPEHAVRAIDAATDGPVAEGAVGGGTGMNCYSFKGGNGTSSRLVRYGDHTYTVAAFVQANFGARAELTVAGVPVGTDLADDNPIEDNDGIAPPGSGSVIAIVATDAPLLPGQCKALARRVPMGLARTGTTGSHFSGDLFLAFSTANAGALNSSFPRSDGPAPLQSMEFVPWGEMDAFYQATAWAVEEAVINVLVAAEEMTGRDGHRSPALPVPRLMELLAARGVC
ncbi:P1 family peptidase [Phytoactinopolyspora limicola]|uniref:DmpA family aminopeptidase n=1 Tax=Phytoactinopolyspora limicola TaxID=2715536 RepID=UPI00140E83F1|nr:P1 family peptidase [Phytoactinopolyspora limicola]